MTRALLSVAATALVVCLCLPTVAQSQTSDTLIQQGLELRRQSRDREALAAFQRAYEMDRSARALAQIALAEQALGSFALAELHLSQALAVQTDVWISSRRGQLEQALVTIEARLGTVELTGGAPGAQVFVNGELRGTLPEAAQLRVRAGSAVIEVRASGYAPVQRQVTISAGGVAREPLNMIQVHGSAGGPVVQRGPQPVGVQPVGVQPVGVQPTYPPVTRATTTHPNWTLFGIGAGLFGASWIGTWIGALASTDDGDVIGLSFAPVLGPFLLSFTIDFGFDEELYLPLLLILDGIVQAGGLVLGIIGLVSQQTDMVAELEGGPRPTRLAVVPLSVPGAQGVALELTHF